MITQSILQILSESEDITISHISRIWASEINDEEKYPLITLTIIPPGIQRVRHLRGAAGIATVRLQIDIYSYDLNEVDDNAEQVWLTLDSYRGTVDGVTILNITTDGDHELHEKPDDASGAALYRRSQDYLIKYRTATTE